MQYAIVSDIHANLQAWNAVLLDIRSLELDSIICLGDVVGYGPSPADTLKSVHANVDHLVLGNHDAVIADKMDPSLFNDTAHSIILWTRQQLNNRAINFLQTLPLTLKNSFFRCAHGDFSNPAAFEYIFTPEEAVPSWSAVDEQLLFVGHTHAPAIFLLGQSHIPRVVAPQDFEIEHEKRYLVNVGSVGQPREQEPRACYAILDSETMVVSWRILPFDLDAFSHSLANANMPAEASEFLEFDPRQEHQVRETIDFSPPSNPEHEVQDTESVREIVQLEHSVSHWKRITTVASIGTALLLLGGGIVWHRHLTREADLIPSAFADRPVWTAPLDTNILMAPAIAVPNGTPVPNWHIHLGARRKQSIEVKLGQNKESFFLVDSSSPEEIRITSPRLAMRPGNKFCLEALFRKAPSFKGTIAVVVSLEKNSGDSKECIDQFVVKEPNLERKDGWLLAKKTFTAPASAISMTYSIRGAFTGSIEIGQPCLYRRD